MLGTSNPIGLVYKPQLSSLDHQSSSTGWFSGPSQEMICLISAVSPAPPAVLFPVQHRSLVSLDCFPQSSAYTAFNNQLAKKKKT